MCFDAKVKMAKVTTEDIVAYKWLKSRTKDGKIQLMSPISGFVIWKLGKVVQAKPFQRKADADYTVDAGLHCFKTLEQAKASFGGAKSFYKVVIPKGSLVHTNETQYCANQMILKSRVPVKKIKTAK